MTNQCALEMEHGEKILRGQLVTPDNLQGKAPGVLVMHDAMGLGKFNEEKAHMLAGMGYVALATDMYGGGVHSDDPNEAGKHFLPFHTNPALIRARVVAWFEQMKSLPQVDETLIAAIGFCFGGQCVLELARSGADVKAVASYHGLLTTPAPAQADSIKGLVAVYTGSKDPYAPRKDVDALREEMTNARANFHLTEFSNAYHAFTNPNPPGDVEAGMQYDPLCDQVSWAGTVALLSHTLKN